MISARDEQRGEDDVFVFLCWHSFLLLPLVLSDRNTSPSDVTTFLQQRAHTHPSYAQVSTDDQKTHKRPAIIFLEPKKARSSINVRPKYSVRY